MVITSEQEELFRSQYGQDRFVYETFFRDKPKGTFFEAGMVAGISISNTFFFEKALGWDGICVEPNPWYFNFVKQRRSAKCFDVALGEEESEVLFLAAEYIGGILKYMDKKHLARVEDSYREKRDKLQLYWVRCVPIMSVFQEAGMDTIDFFSLDIEGGEIDVLKTIDFSKVRINVVAVESQYGISGELHELMTGAGFLFVRRLGGDEIFVNNEFR